jgi:hypothetical protein
MAAYDMADARNVVFFFIKMNEPRIRRTQFPHIMAHNHMSDTWSPPVGVLQLIDGDNKEEPGNDQPKVRPTSPGQSAAGSERERLGQ